MRRMHQSSTRVSTTKICEICVDSVMPLEPIIIKTKQPSPLDYIDGRHIRFGILPEVIYNYVDGHHIRFGTLPEVYRVVSRGCSP